MSPFLFCESGFYDSGDRSFLKFYWKHLSMIIRYCLFVSLLLQISCMVNTQSVNTSVAASGSNQSIIRYDSIHHPVIARHGMVVTQNELSSGVGKNILEQGGNAVDATVAIGFALAVTLPRAGNLGGSGFMLIHMAEPGETVALDFRSIAPMAARLEDFLDEDGDILWDDLTFGVRAPAVPGTVAGLYHAWQKFGSLPWPVLLSPAINLAKEGIVVSDDLAYALAEAMPVMSEYPSSISTYAKDVDASYLAGEVLHQPDLAWSLEKISEQGADAVYSGDIAEKIIQFMERSGGYISLQDLQNYQVKEREPIATNYRQYKIVTMPPSSVGGLALLQMLNVLKQFDLARFEPGSARSLHLLAEIMKRVNANRRQGIGDTDFVSVPIKGILSEELAKEIAASIDLEVASSVSIIKPTDANPYDSRETTHYSVMDDFGNAVSTSYTLGYSFGSGIVVPGTGILLDNQMRNFYHRESGHANEMKPGKRPVSTMTPTLVFDVNDEIKIATGTPGGSRIHNVIMQLLVNLIDYQMNIAEATHAPRIYQGWRTSELAIERGINADTSSLLKIMGHDVQLQQTMGSTQSIAREEGRFYGSADPRRPGALALGVDDVPH